VKEWREKKYVFWLFLLIWKDISLLPTYPKVGSKSCSSSLKIYLVGWVDFKVLKKKFLEGMKDLKV